MVFRESRRIVAVTPLLPIHAAASVSRAYIGYGQPVSGRVAGRHLLPINGRVPPFFDFRFKFAIHHDDDGAYQVV